MGNKIMSYLKLLESSYNQALSRGEFTCSKLEFIGNHIFEFETYEDVVLSLMTKKAIEVCGVITNFTTFDYIKDDNNNMWFLVMVNMPFFKNKLEWGVSIRGAWWDCYPNKCFKLESCGIYNGEEYLYEIEFDDKEWFAFIEAISVFTLSERQNLQ